MGQLYALIDVRLDEDLPNDPPFLSIPPTLLTALPRQYRKQAERKLRRYYLADPRISSRWPWNEGTKPTPFGVRFAAAVGAFRRVLAAEPRKPAPPIAVVLEEPPSS